MPVEKSSASKKPERQIPTGHRFSNKKTTTVPEKTMNPRSCLRWQLTGRILKTVGLSARMVSQKMKSSAKTFDRSRSSLGLHGNDVCSHQFRPRLVLHQMVSAENNTSGPVVRLGINPMIQPEPEDLPKDNPKLEIAVLRCFVMMSLRNYKRGNRRRSKQIVKPELRTIVETPVATMADTHTMSELLQAPIEGYEDAIVLPAILAKYFELNVRLLTLVTLSQFLGFERDDPHSHIRWFYKINSTLKCKNVPHDAITLMLFPFSLEGAAWIWLEKERPRSIHKWEDLVSKFVNYFFPPSKTTNLKNDITNFQQRFDETFREAWDRFKDLLRKCPHHGFSELHQIDTFYNALTQSDQDSLNAAGGNLLNRTPRDALSIIENKSKVRTSRNKLVVSKVSDTTSSSPAYLLEITALTDAIKAMLLQNKTPSPAPVKAIEETCVTCGGPHPYYECLATDGNTFNASAATGTYNQGGSGYRPQGETNYRASNPMRPPGFP
ncbi:reverse transcriptase domain-containing protein [Tanacetum coccineum]